MKTENVCDILKSRVIYIYITFAGKERDLLIYKKNTLRRAAAAAAAICLAFAFAFAEETGADKLGFGTSVTVNAAELIYNTGTTAKLYYIVGANDEITITQAIAGSETRIDVPESIDGKNVTAIEMDAFRGNYYLESVTLPQSVKSIGKSAFENCYKLTSIDIPTKVTAISDRTFSGCPSLKSVNIPSNVTSIGEYAFENCISLANITIPSSVTSIGEGAFFNCYALASIDIPANVTSIGSNTFERCTSLAGITMPSVTSIEESAFKGCSALKDIDMPNIVSIGNYAFKGCTSLAGIAMPSVTSIGNSAFNGCSALKDIDMPNIVSIGNNTFKDCTSLESITFPPSVTRIGDNAFLGCTSLETVIFPESAALSTPPFPSDTAQIRYTKDSSTGNVTISRAYAETSIEIPETICGGTVTALGPQSFSNRDTLEEIKLPKTLTDIGEKAFYYCTSLKEIEIPQNVSVIGGDAFLNCTSLKTVYLPEGLSGSAIQNNATKIYYSYRPAEAKTSIARVEAGDQTDIVIPQIISGGKVDAIKKAAFINNDKIKSVTLPDGLISIGEEAFTNCTALTGITIPDSVENIGIYAFDKCTSLVSAKLPDNEDLFIGGGAFSRCSSLESIVIPDGVTTIEKNLFVNCEKLESVTLPDSIISIGDNAFYNCKKLVSINLPADLGTIGEYAFYACISLASVDLPSKLTVIGQEAFLGCERLTSVTIPDSVTELGAGAFECCYNLADVTLPKGLRVLRSSVLRWTAIKSIVIPETVTQINDGAFNKCGVLESIELPPNVSYVGDMAFEDCPALKNVFYNTGTDVSDSKIPDTSARTKYEIRDGYAYILEIIPDSSSTPVVIPDTICGYEVMSTAEEYRQYVSETGHTHKGGTATCTEKALCDICGNSYDSTDSTNHDADTSVWKYDENGHWNPCLRAGCEEHLNAAAHTFDNGVVTTEPTENSEGVKTYTCETCGYQKTKSIPKLGHTPSAEWSYDSENHWKKCTNEGCNEKFELAAHTFDNGVITAEPTETSEGVRTYTCTVCGYEKTESIEKLPPKPAKVIYPIKISGDVTADKSSAAAGENVNVSAPFGYDIIVADINGRQIAKFSEKGSFTMPASGVSITAVRGEIFTHMSNAWSHSYVYSYDSDMNRIKVNSDTRRGVITIDLGADYAGRDFTVYSGRKNTSKKIISGTLDENGRYIFNSEEGKNYTLVVE